MPFPMRIRLARFARIPWLTPFAPSSRKGPDIMFEPSPAGLFDLPEKGKAEPNTQTLQPGSHTLLLVDGHSLLYRAFFVLPAMRTANGFPTSGWYGFLRMLTRAWADFHPSALVVTLDKGKPFRAVSYPAYKATRQKTPEDLSLQLEGFESFLQRLKIPYLAREGMEADDLIASLATDYQKKGWKILILTGDKDLLQLLAEGIQVVVTRKGVTDVEVYDEQRFLTEFGFSAGNLVDYKALIGDASDNIPGVPGVGEKTAKALLTRYGSLEAIFAHLKDLPERLQKSLNTHREHVLQGRLLVSLRRDVELSHIPLLPLNLSSPESRETLKQLEFTSFLPPDSAPPVQVEEKVHLMELEATLKNALTLQRVYLSFTQEGLSVASDHYLSFLPFPQSTRSSSFPTGRWEWGNGSLELLRQVWLDAGVEKVVYDVKKIYHCFPQGCTPVGKVYDLALMSYLLHPEEKNDWEDLRRRYLQDSVLPPDDKVKARLLKILFPPLLSSIRQEGMEEILLKWEVPLAFVLTDMERWGIRLNPQVLTEISKLLKIQLESLQETAYTMVGHPFNLNSPSQVATVLFDELKLPKVRKTSTDAGVLTALRDAHPLVPLLLQYRTLSRLWSGYLEPLPKQVDAEGRIRTTFLQTGTSTGRLASRDPNLQNIPARGEWASPIRKAFIPTDSSYLFLSADYSQIDLRLLAHLSGDENLRQGFLLDEDIHARTAMELFQVSREEVSPDLRRRAKAVNFGIIYGMTDFGLAQQLDISREEAKAYIQKYKEAYPGVQAFIQRTIEAGRRNGYVRTLFGRLRWVKDISSANATLRREAERIAINTSVQGSSADILMRAMVVLHSRLNPSSSRLLLQVHDELLLEVKRSALPTVAKDVKSILEEAPDLSVPLKVDLKIGDSWGELTPYEGIH